MIVPAKVIGHLHSPRAIVWSIGPGRILLRMAVPKRDFLVFSGAPGRAATDERHIAIHLTRRGIGRSGASRDMRASCKVKRSTRERERYSNLHKPPKSCSAIPRHCG